MRRAPRILAVTAGPVSKRNSFTAALQDLYGAEILPGKQLFENRTDRLLAKIGMGTVGRNIDLLNETIRARADQFDIFFVVKGNFVTAETLKALKTQANPPRVIGWSPDDIYLAHNQTSVLRSAAPYYDVFYTAKSLNITNGELKAMGFVDPRYLQQGFDREMHRPLPRPASRFSSKVVFIGFGELDRFEKLNHLARNGMEVHVWGNGWTAQMRRRAECRLHIHGHGLLGDDYADALTNSAISLCFLRKLNRDTHTSRTFEIPACGGFMLAERTDEHLQFFQEDREAVYFADADELLKKVQYYLAYPEDRNRIAAAGRRRSLDSDYSYHRLARDVVEEAMAAAS